MLLRLSALATVLLAVPVFAQTLKVPLLSESESSILAGARAHEARGDDQRAFEAYRQFLQSDRDTIDVALRFAAMARARLGAEAARARLAEISVTNPALVLAAATLADITVRRKLLDAFVWVHPDYGPAYALLAEEYGKPQFADQPLRDRLRERELLTRFLALDARGKLAERFVDSGVLATWIERAERRLAVLDAALTNAAAAPSARFSRSNSSWLVYLNMPETPVSVGYRLGEVGPFTSTGVAGSLDMRTGRNLANVHFQLPLDTPATAIHVTYRDIGGNVSGPYKIAFDPREVILANDRKTLDDEIPGWANFAGQSHREWLYFNTLMYARCAIRKAEYGFNGSPDREFVLPPCNLANPNATPADAQSAVKMPDDARMIAVRLTFLDGKVETRMYKRP